MTNLERRLEQILDWYLEDNTFEDFLEEFDLTPLDVFIHLFETGMIDETKLEEFLLDI